MDFFKYIFRRKTSIEKKIIKENFRFIKSIYDHKKMKYMGFRDSESINQKIYNLDHQEIINNYEKVNGQTSKIYLSDKFIDIFLEQEKMLDIKPVHEFKGCIPNRLINRNINFRIVGEHKYHICLEYKKHKTNEYRLLEESNNITQVGLEKIAKSGKNGVMLSDSIHFSSIFSKREGYYRIKPSYYIISNSTQFTKESERKIKIKKLDLLESYEPKYDNILLYRTSNGYILLNSWSE